MNNRVFILGDSRTGTSTLGTFLKALGFNSIHYYVNEARQIQPDHLNHSENWKNLQTFIDGSEYNAFSDYPTRLFYKELSKKYDAKFILTTRKDTKTWKNSMEKYFSKFNLNLNLVTLEKAYLDINQDIRKFFKDEDKIFLEICIDDDSTMNSNKIKTFLGIYTNVEMGWDNKSSDVDIEKPSSRKLLHTLSKGNPVTYLKNMCLNEKVVLSEYGWIFLINDSNNFLEYFYGLRKWSNNDLEKTKNKFKKRNSFFKSKNIKYVKFIIPEKPTIYSEYLPKILKDSKVYENRPAILLDMSIDNVHYLNNYLYDLKSYGTLYFRGDSHTNWVGSYYIYTYIIEKLNFMSIKTKSLIKMDEMNVSIGKYRGDLYTQLDDRMINDLHSVWGNFNLESGLSYDIEFKLSDIVKKSYIVKPEVIHLQYADSREVLVYENRDKTLPSCVMFRDSTADNIIELLAEHFSRIVFIWHGGNIYEDILDYEKPDVVIHTMAERFISDYPDVKVPFLKCKIK